jgi:hypothetical protein
MKKISSLLMWKATGCLFSNLPLEKGTGASKGLLGWQLLTIKHG